MADDKRETRKAILGELESIKDLLLDQEDIPILNDAIDTPPISASNPDPPPVSAQEEETPPQQNTLATDGIGTTAETTGKQQSLFNESGEADAHPKARPPETRQNRAPGAEKPGPGKAGNFAKPAMTTAIQRENPFLPKHIRDRLHTHRSLIDEINDSPIGSRRGPRGKDAVSADSTSFAAVTTHLPTTANSPNAIVEGLIAEFMPKIEAELRRRLEAIIQAPDQKPEENKNKQ